MLINNSPVYAVTPALLSCMDKTDLIDLLQHKTELLVSAFKSKVADQKYLESIHSEVVSIQNEIKKRLA